MKEYNPIKSWSKEFLNKRDLAYPSEYLIRIFKGKYPKLKLSGSKMDGMKICDVGCGDGRNLILLNDCGFKIFGKEISEEIVQNVKNKMNDLNIDCNIQVGINNKNPFTDKFFDFLVSWNSCYYMGNNLSFESHVKEFYRVLKPEGFLILSIPMKSCFIFSKSEEIQKGYQVIKHDPFNVRNGEVLRMFFDEKEIEKEFSKYFTNFIFGTIKDDCFGLNYHWHLIICQKKK